jgi:hypothetical protein
MKASGPSTGAPEIMMLPMNREQEFIEMPLIAGSGTTALELITLLLAELPAPLPDRFINHDNPAGNEQFVDVPIAEAKPVIGHTPWLITSVRKR